jgi:hypothetical protein
MRRRLAFAKDVDHLYLLELMAKELMLPEVSCRKPCRDTFKVSGVRLSSMPGEFLRELEGFLARKLRS